MFKYVNPGYIAFLNSSTASEVRVSDINPINKVSFKQEERAANILLPENVTEIFIRTDIFFVPNPETGKFTDNYCRVYAGTASNVQTGTWVESPTKMGINNNGEDEGQFDVVNLQDVKPHTIEVHMKIKDDDYNNNFIRVYLDGKLVKTYNDRHAISGASYFDRVLLFGGPNTYFCNVIVADHTCLNEKVVEVPIKDETTDFEKSSNDLKATKVGQSVTGTINYNSINKAITDAMALGTITSVGGGVCGFQRGTDINIMDLTMTDRSGSLVADTGRLVISTNNGVSGLAEEKTFRVDEIDGLKIKATVSK